jgi:hypothetical protein
MVSYVHVPKPPTCVGATTRRPAVSAVAEPQYMESSDFARRFNVSTAAVFKWEREGLISPLRTTGGRRLFTEADVVALERARAERAAARARRPTEGDAA